jgi:hypothetical protein
MMMNCSHNLFLQFTIIADPRANTEQNPGLEKKALLTSHAAVAGGTGSTI